VILSDQLIIRNYTSSTAWEADCLPLEPNSVIVPVAAAPQLVGNLATRALSVGASSNETDASPALLALSSSRTVGPRERDPHFAVQSKVRAQRRLLVPVPGRERVGSGEGLGEFLGVEGSFAFLVSLFPPSPSCCPSLCSLLC